MTHNTKFDSMNDLSNEHCISGNSILKTKKTVLIASQCSVFSKESIATFTLLKLDTL